MYSILMVKLTFTHSRHQYNETFQTCNVVPRAKNIYVNQIKCETNKSIVIYKQTWVAESCERKRSCGDYTITSFILRAYRSGEMKFFIQCLCFINFLTLGQASAVTVLSSQLSIIKTLYIVEEIEWFGLTSAVTLFYLYAMDCLSVPKSIFILALWVKLRNLILHL